MNLQLSPEERQVADLFLSIILNWLPKLSLKVIKVELKTHKSVFCSRYHSNKADICCSDYKFEGDCHQGQEARGQHEEHPSAMTTTLRWTVIENWCSKQV